MVPGPGIRAAYLRPTAWEFQVEVPPGAIQALAARGLDAGAGLSFGTLLWALLLCSELRESRSANSKPCATFYTRLASEAL